MSDFISRDAAIEAVCGGCNEQFDDEPCEPSCCSIRERLQSLPAADVRPVVLCRECKHKGWVQEPEHGKSVDYCRLIERCVDKQFFCGCGEKREET